MNTTTDYSMVKPTRYAGIEFRSRLEARWAVFFDSLGIKWEYEPETFIARPFDDSAPVQYTPDFRLHIASTPGHKFKGDSSMLYAEVKPTADAVYAHQSKLSTMIDYGGPLASGVVLLGPVRTTYTESPVWPMLRWHLGVELVYGHFSWQRFTVHCEEWGSSAPYLPKDINFDLVAVGVPATDQVTSAYNAARDARFGLGGRR